MDVQVDVSGRLGRIQQHVGDDRHTDAPPLMVGQIHLPDADRGSDPQQPRPGEQSSFRNRTKVVDLQLDGCETAHPVIKRIQGGSNGRIGDTRGDASVQRTGAVQQFRAHATPDGDAIAMRADQFQSQQVIERMPGEKISNVLELALGIAQTW